MQPDDQRWTARHTWLVLLTALAIVSDGVDNQLLGVSIPAILREWSIARSAFAPVVSLGYVGMMIGSGLAGIVGDRAGRRTALLASLAIFGSATLASVLADSAGALAALRCVAGVGLGGAIPNAATLAAEYVPRPHRSIAVTVTIVCVPLGATIAGLLGSQVLARSGWRTLFVIGGLLPLVLLPLLWRALPESPRYLAGRGERGSSIRALFDAGVRRDTFALWASFLSCLLAVYLGFSWLPSLLAGAGFGPSVASNGITAFNLGGVAGALGGGFAFSRIGSRAAMLGMTGGAVAGLFALSMMTIHAGMPQLRLFALLTLSGGLINAVQTTMYALAANVYASTVRATGVGFAAGIGRVGAIISGYLGAWAIDYRGNASYFGVMAAAMCVCFVGLAAVQRHQPARR